MGGKRFTVLPILVAMALAISSMPTDYFNFSQRHVGIAKAEPWRSKASSALASAGRSITERIRTLLAATGGLPSLAGGAAVLALLATTADGDSAIFAGAMVGGSLKLYRQRDADLKAEIAKAKKDRAAIGSAAVAEKRSLTDDERAKFTAAAPAITALEEQLADNAELLAVAEAANEAERALGVTAPVDPDQAATARGAKAAGVQVGKDNAQDDPKRGFKSHADQLQAIMRAGQTGVVDHRLKPLAAAGSDEQSGHTDPHGGFLLAPAFAPGILSVPAEVDPTAGRVTSIPMTNSRVVFNARVDKDHTSSVSGGLTVSRTPAAKAATGSRQAFEQVELVAHDLVGAAFATNRILRESPISFIALMQAAFGDEFAAKKLDERLNGSGAGEYAGVISDAATITVSKETGQAADTIVFENVNKMASRCWRYGSAIWLVNHDALPQVTTLYMPIGTGGERIPIYAPGKEDAPFGTLLGRPIFPTEFCRTVGDKGDLVLSNWSQYLEGNYGQMEEARSIHVRFLEREECFLFVEMNDGKPWWRSALTPKYSAQTLSPFVVLAAR